MITREAFLTVLVRTPCEEQEQHAFREEHTSLWQPPWGVGTTATTPSRGEGEVEAAPGANEEGSDGRTRGRRGDDNVGSSTVRANSEVAPRGTAGSEVLRST